MARTLSIGGATFDLFVRTEKNLIQESNDQKSFALPLGGKIRVQEVQGTCGGGANNTAVGLARLGCTAAFAGVFGSDQWGEMLLKNMEREQIDTQFTTVVEDETTSFSLILLAESGERTILYDPGTNRHLHDVTFDRQAAATMDWIYLNHMHADSCVIEDDLIAMLEATPALRLTWNPGGNQIETGLLAKHNRQLLSHCDLLLLNKEEALGFTKGATTEEALRLLLEAGASAICITDGKNGVLATDGTSLYQATTPSCRVVDTTGAGDAFGTGVTWGLLSGKDLPTALKAGTINAMSVVGAIGAQAGLLTQTQMQHTLSNLHLEIIQKPL